MALAQIQSAIWAGRLPLEIRLTPAESRIFDQTDPYLISLPRLSYLALLLPRLHAFFAPFLIDDQGTVDPYSGHFTHDSVPLKWHLPLGLLYDIYALSTPTDDHTPISQSTLPFKLQLSFRPDHDASPTSTTTTTATSTVHPNPPVLHDSFINSVKEADFLRSGTARPIMSLSAADSRALWSAAQSTDLGTWSKIHHALLPPSGQWRHIPLRLYIPTSHHHHHQHPSSPPSEAVAANAHAQAAPTPTAQPQPQQPHPQAQAQAQIKVLQSPLPPLLSGTTTTNPAQPPTLGAALHALAPALFPSRRTPILARPVVHGAPVPMSAGLEELARWACYADGWVNVGVVLNG